MRNLLYLVKMMEECGEVIQAASKVMIHGDEAIHPTTGVVNKAHLQAEMEDVLAIFSIISVAYELDAHDMADMIPRKVKKIESVIAQAIDDEIAKAE